MPSVINQVLVVLVQLLQAVIWLPELMAEEVLSLYSPATTVCMFRLSQASHVSEEALTTLCKETKPHLLMLHGCLVGDKTA